MNDATLTAFRQIASDMGINPWPETNTNPAPINKPRRDYQGILIGDTMQLQVNGANGPRHYTWVLRAPQILSGPNTGKYMCELPHGEALVGDTERKALAFGFAACYRLGYRTARP